MEDAKRKRVACDDGEELPAPKAPALEALPDAPAAEMPPRYSEEVTHATERILFDMFAVHHTQAGDLAVLPAADAAMAAAGGAEGPMTHTEAERHERAVDELCEPTYAAMGLVCSAWENWAEEARRMYPPDPQDERERRYHEAAMEALERGDMAAYSRPDYRHRVLNSTFEAEEGPAS
jgi:hypothetical protein